MSDRCRSRSVCMASRRGKQYRRASATSGRRPLPGRACCGEGGEGRRATGSPAPAPASRPHTPPWTDWLSPSPSVADPRIDDGVDQVDPQVREPDQDGVDGEDRDGYVVVVLEDALDELLAQPRNAEDILNDDAADDDADDGGAEDARYRNQGVTQRVPKHDDSVRQALGARRADVV